MGADEDPKLKPIPVPVAMTVEGKISNSTIGIYQEVRSFQEMGPEQAEALKAVAQAQFAVPAQEETKQAIQLTRRFYVGALVAVLGFIAMVIRPEVQPGVGVVVGVLEGGLVVSHVIDKRKRKQKLPAPDPGSGAAE